MPVEHFLACGAWHGMACQWSISFSFAYSCDMTLSIHYKVQHQLLDFLKYFIYRRDFISALKVYQTLIPLYHVYGNAVLLPQILGLLRRASEAYEVTHVDQGHLSWSQLESTQTSHDEEGEGEGEGDKGDENHEQEQELEQELERERERAAETRSNAFMRFLQQLFAVDVHHVRHFISCVDMRIVEFEQAHCFLTVVASCLG